MRTLLAMMFVACSSGAHGVDAQHTPLECEATFEQAVDRACSIAADCVLLTHPDCCGDVVIGVAAAGQVAAMSANATYNACVSASCGGRGCQHATLAEDGNVPTATQSIVAACLQQRCSSVVQ